VGGVAVAITGILVAIMMMPAWVGDPGLPPSCPRHAPAMPWPGHQRATDRDDPSLWRWVSTMLSWWTAPKC